MSDHLTPWFSVNDKPHRVGVYERDHEDGCMPCFQYWNGKQWSCLDLTVESAYRDRFGYSRYQNGKWRGLANKPEGVTA